MTKFSTGAAVNHKSNGYTWIVEHTDADGLVLCTTVCKDGSVVQMQFHEDNLNIDETSMNESDLVTDYNNSLP